MNQDQLKEVMRRSSLLARHHLDMLTAEQSLSESDLLRLVKSHERTVSQESPQPINLSIKAESPKTKSTYIDISLGLLSGIVKTLDLQSPLTSALGSNIEAFKHDDKDELFRDVCIATFTIRNQALTMIYGEEIGNEVEARCVDACVTFFKEEGYRLYDEFKRLWIFSLADDALPHMEICKKIYMNTCYRIKRDYSENPLAEFALADMIINCQVGIWLRMYKAFDLIPDR